MSNHGDIDPVYKGVDWDYIYKSNAPSWWREELKESAWMRLLPKDSDDYIHRFDK